MVTNNLNIIIRAIVLSVFLSPVVSNLIWGAGPVFHLPTATDKLLGAEKFYAGFTAVVLDQNSPWTIGILTNLIWSFLGEDEPLDVRATYFHPFLSHTNKMQCTIGISSEDTYDWISYDWTGAVLLNTGQVAIAGKRYLSLGISGKYYFAHPVATPWWGGRAIITFIFPKGGKKFKLNFKQFKLWKTVKIFSKA